MAKAVELSAYQLKVTLLGIRPPIWRQLEVRGDTKLGRLHHILQVAMGWTNNHLHQFIARGIFYGPVGPETDMDQKDEDKIRLDRVLSKSGDRMIYEYDFGDSWEHDVVVEKLLPAASGRGRYPMVTGGRRACPPEDCGGVPGYCHMLKVLGKPKHREYKDLMEWLGEEYDPEAFDMMDVNRAFHGGWAPVNPKA